MNEIVYGYLIVLGTNGRKSWRYSDNKKETNKLKVVQRLTSNGIKEIRTERYKKAISSQAVLSKNRHAVSYTLSHDEAIVVEYGSDPETDMFQIGRCTEDQIDFVVNSVPIDDKMQNPKSYKTAVPETVSRYACRILINRSVPYTARIYAAGFDSNKNIYLGENAIKWQADKKMIDGFTTNGVMIRHTDVDFDPDKRAKNSIMTVDHDHETFQNSSWREISVSGAVYSCLSKRSVPQSKSMLHEENILRDGTLIDLCGVTLIWRSDFTDSEIADDLLSLCLKLNETHMQCPIGYQTLKIIPDLSGLNNESRDHSDQKKHNSKPVPHNCNRPYNQESRPYVYLKCGHVHGFHEWMMKEDNDNCRTCPLCKQRSPFVPLSLGQETAFFLDLDLPTFCFNPCGHMGSEATVKYWYNVLLPNRKNSELSPRCPFCYVECAEKPLKLIFS